MVTGISFFIVHKLRRIPNPLGREGWISVCRRMNSALEFQGKKGSFPNLGLNRDRSFVELHDLAGKTEPNSRPFFFGCEEGNEDISQVFVLNATPIVPHLDQGPVGFGLGDTATSIKLPSQLTRASWHF